MLLTTFRFIYKKATQPSDPIFTRASAKTGALSKFSSLPYSNSSRSTYNSKPRQNTIPLLQKLPKLQVLPLESTHQEPFSLPDPIPQWRLGFWKIIFGCCIGGSVSCRCSPGKHKRDHY